MIGSSRRAFLYGLLFVVGGVLLLRLGGCSAESPRPSVDAGINPAIDPRVTYHRLNRIIQHEPKAAGFVVPVRRAVRRHRRRHPVDPLLVLALIKHESGFDTLTVSRVGAGGPLQIMPATARELGMEPVEETEDLKQGLQWQRRAAGSLSRAVEAMKAEEYLSMRRHVESWRNLRSRSREALSSYREHLRSTIRGKSQQELRTIDQRFVTEMAVDKGVQYLARMLDRREGDIREALSAYNAGPTTVRRYHGIPPYDETVRYQNRIVNTYREYRRWIVRANRQAGDTPDVTQRHIQRE